MLVQMLQHHFTLISLVFIKADFDPGQIARIIQKALGSNQVC